MKKWILIFTLIVLIGIGLSINVYLQARKPLNSAESKAEKIARSKADLKDVEDYYLYNGNKSYSAIIGKQKNGRKVVVMIPNQTKSNPIVYKWSDGISKNDALQELKTVSDPQKITGVRLGMENNEPVWEISFLNSASKLNYFYISFLKSSHYSKLIENI